MNKQVLKWFCISILAIISSFVLGAVTSDDDSFLNNFSILILIWTLGFIIYRAIIKHKNKRSQTDNSETPNTKPKKFFNSILQGLGVMFLAMLSSYVISCFFIEKDGTANDKVFFATLFIWIVGYLIYNTTKFIKHKRTNSSEETPTVTYIAGPFPEYNEPVGNKATLTNDQSISYLSRSTDLFSKPANQIDDNNSQNNLGITMQLLADIGFKDNLDLTNVDDMLIIKTVEEKLQDLYSNFYKNAYSAAIGKKIYSRFERSCKSSKLPLAAETRIYPLLDEYRNKFENPNMMGLVDAMKEQDFIKYCAILLIKNGFEKVEIISNNDNQGVDIIAVMSGLRYAIKCKCQLSNLNKRCVQEVYIGKDIHNCQYSIVLTNRYFSEQASELARSIGVLLFDRDRLQSMIETARQYDESQTD